MKKKHQNPELSVARQKQANAKFFVASSGGGGNFGNASSGGAGGPDGSASRYDEDANGLNM